MLKYCEFSVCPNTIHDNETTLLQDFPELGTIQEDQRYKRMDYRYDLISGNVHQVSYQAGKPDQWYHRYEYDADNRITAAFTSRYGWEGDTTGTNLFMDQDVPFWENDATYRYYLHGPLARVETGDIAVQGTDYAYTLQGWIKGVNSNTLSPHRDPGQDGNTGSVNELFGRDVSGYTLGYYSGDYRPVNTADHWTTLTDRFEADLTGSNLLYLRKDLFNGNIGWMVNSQYAPPGTTVGGTDGRYMAHGKAYTYDQLNRISQHYTRRDIDSAANQWDSGTSAGLSLYNAFTYDPNGNILTQERHGYNSSTLFDDLTYQYALDSDGRPVQNRLYHVNDAVSASAPTDDIEDQGTFDPDLDEINQNNNYGYDELGQLIRDNAESIDSIDWRVDGKIRQVIRPDTSSRKELEFVYDAMGNRIAKRVMSADGTWEKTTYYLRDAQGNVMCVYEHTEADETASLMLQEEHIYGSSRLGMRADTLEMIGADPVRDTLDFPLERGMKRYELSNHLGNVLTVISDQKLAMDSSSVFDYYLPEVLAYNDYYPFGAPVNELSWSGEEYRYGFNGKEKDSEGLGGGLSTYDYGFRIYNPALGRFLSTDPLLKAYPWNSTYCFSENTVINSIDMDGLERYQVVGNNIVISMKFAAFTSRPEGGNVPSDLDIKAQSRQNWDEFNMECNMTYGLNIQFDENGNVDYVTSGETQYTIQFNVEVEVFETENSPEFTEFAKSEAFSGVYLFGNTEFNDRVMVNGVPDNVPARTISIDEPNSLYSNKEAVNFSDATAFGKTVEIHEDGHVMGLGHWSTNTSFGQKVPPFSLRDPIQGSPEFLGEKGEKYDSEGMMQYDGGNGSQRPKQTQVINLLNTTDGSK